MKKLDENIFNLSLDGDIKGAMTALSQGGVKLHFKAPTEVHQLRIAHFKLQLRIALHSFAGTQLAAMCVNGKETTVRSQGNKPFLQFPILISNCCIS